MRFQIDSPFDVTAGLGQPLQSRLARYALITLLLLGICCAAMSAHKLARLIAVMRTAKQAVTMQVASLVTSLDGSALYVDQSQGNDSGFVSELPVVSPGDLQIRYAAKLAHEQGASVLQMQSAALKTDPKGLGQSRITLQLRGDYRDIKNVWIALLAKYPGLTLQRLTLRHHTELKSVPSPQAAAVALPAADRADDEATIEMIQYTQPLALTR